MKKIESGDPESMSQNIVAQNIEQLRALFPEAWREGKLDFDVLKELLGGLVDEREEKFGLNWHGKRQARRLALSPSLGTLIPCPDESVNWDQTKNVMIEGDNLEVLKLLQKSYAGKIKMIYIDPPYNTGKDFVYPDDFSDGVQNYLKVTGQIDGDGRRLSTNAESSGRFHTNWLSMIYPRLKVSRSLLSEDGLLYVSCDDNELKNLLHVCDEIFGEENFQGIFVINSSPSAIDYGHIAKMHEYIVFYSKNTDFADTRILEDEDKSFKYTDSTGPFNIYPLYNGNVAFNPRTRPNLFYPFYLNPQKKIDGDFFEISLENPGDWVEVYPVVSQKDGIQRVWRWGRDKSRGELNKEIVGYKTEDGEYRVVQKTRLTGKMIRSLQLDTEISSRRGTADVESHFRSKVFSFPKSVELIRRLVATATESGDIVLDFFAGSGTTAEAVLRQNSMDGGRRRYVLVQLPEVLDETLPQSKPAIDYCEKTKLRKNIAALTIQRLKLASSSIKDKSPLIDCDCGFRVFRLNSSCINLWNPNRDEPVESLLEAVDHIKADRSTDDLLYELLIKLGLDLCVEIDRRKIAEKDVCSIGAGALFVCLTAEIKPSEAEQLSLGIIAWHKEQSPAGESTIVFRDSAFADDVTKTNVTAILQQHGLENVRSL